VTLIRGHPKGSRVVPLDSCRIQRYYRYDFLLVINCTGGRILNRFRDIAFDMSNVAIFGYPSWVSPPTEGFPWDDFRVVLHSSQQMARLQNGAETLPNISTGWVGSTKVTDRETTDRRICDGKYPNVKYYTKRMVHALLSHYYGIFFIRHLPKIVKNCWRFTINDGL